MIAGQDRAVGLFSAAWQSRHLHHAWLLAGPKGVGKASFAGSAARRVLAETAGPPFDLAALEAPEDHPVVKLIDAGSHPASCFQHARRRIGVDQRHQKNFAHD